MQFIKQFKKITNFQKRVKILKKFLVICKNKVLFNSFCSACLRIIFSSKFIFKTLYPLLKRGRNIKAINEFWIIQIGFSKQKNYLPFISLDNYLSNCILCCNLINLPFDTNSCQMIYIKHFFLYFKRKNFQKIIKSLKKRLIPGGMLKLQINLSQNEQKLEKLKRKLIQNNFFLKEINDYDLKINGTITITAINQIKLKISKIIVISEKFRDITEIINQNRTLFREENDTLLIGVNSEIIYNSLDQINLKIKRIKQINSIENISDIPENQFDNAIVADFFEHTNYHEYKLIFKELKRVIKPDGDILIIVPDKTNYCSKYSTHLFDKGIFLQIIDENNIYIENLTLSSSFKMLQLWVKNRLNFPLEKNNIKVLLLGIYSMRYSFLSNARWDSQARAFEKMGFNIRMVDLEDVSFKYIVEVIKRYKPDILWVGGKEGGNFLRANANYFKEKKFKIVYWLWDIIKHKSFDFSKIIDFMFITSKGEISLFKEAYNLKNVYFMPVAIIPEIIGRNRYIKEKFDIGFAGQLSLTIPIYKERTQMVNYFKEHYNFKFIAYIFNYVSEEYMQCKIVYAGDPYFKDLELYASNRPYIALACGSCIITNYFKGLEKIAVNKKHLLWYNNMEELKQLLDEYLSNNELREKIRQNAEKLAREKHNYIARISNMLDIINQKTESFYGFI